MLSSAQESVAESHLAAAANLAAEPLQSLKVNAYGKHSLQYLADVQLRLKLNNCTHKSFPGVKTLAAKISRLPEDSNHIHNGYFTVFNSGV